MRKRSVSQTPKVVNHDALSNSIIKCPSITLSASDLLATSELLLDKKAYALKYKHFYSLLKFAHKQLQISYSELEKKFTHALQDWLAEKNWFSESLEIVKSENQELKDTCAEYQKKTLTEERLELLKLQIAHNFEQRSKEHLDRAQHEAECARKKCAQMAVELALVNSEADKLRLASEADQEKDLLLYQSEKKNVHEAHQEVVDRLSSLLTSDTESLTCLYKENMQMRAKCNLLLEETSKHKNRFDLQLAELKMELKNVIDQLSETNTQNAVLMAKCDAFEDEIQVMRENCRRSQMDLSVARQATLDSEQSRLGTEKHFEGIAQRSRVELANIRLEAQRQRVDIESQRDELAFQIQEMTNHIALAFAKFTEVEEAHRQREVEMEARETELRQINETATQEVHEKLTQVFRQLEQTQVALRELTVENATTTTALEQVKQDKNGLVAQLVHLQDFNAHLANQINSTQADIVQRNREVQSLESALKELSRSELHVSEKDLSSNNTAQIEQTQAVHVAGIRDAYTLVLERVKRENTALNEKCRTTNSTLQAAQIELEKLRLENMQLRNSVPQTDFLTLQAQLNDFLRRKEGYRLLLQQSNTLFD